MGDLVDAEENSTDGVSEKPEEQQEFWIPIIRTSHGYVRVRARNKNEAEKATQSMGKKRLLGFYKQRYEFVKVGEATVAEPEND